MKRIIKNPEEPPDFTNWRASKQEEIDRKLDEGVSGNTLWELLPSSLPRPETAVEESVLFSKAILRQTLLKEQGYLCCYCNRSLTNDHTTVIEHFKPKGLAVYRSFVFEYENLFACCDGGERDAVKPRETYCTLYKDKKDPIDPYPIISPLEANCEDLFEFDEQGQIHASGGNERAERTITFLNLHAKSLKLQRSKAIDTYIYDIWTEDMDTNEELERLLTKVNDKYESFCTAIYSVLRNYP